LKSSIPFILVAGILPGGSVSGRAAEAPLPDASNAAAPSLSASFRSNEPTPAWPFPVLADLTPCPDPDPLVFLDGRRVRTKEDWEARKQEIIRLADHYIFGSPPAEGVIEGTPTPECTVTEEKALGGAATSKLLDVYLAPDGKDASADTAIHVRMTIPSEGLGPHPTILFLGHAQPTVKEPAGTNPLAAIQLMVGRGYAVCGFSPADGRDMYRHYFPEHSGPWVKRGSEERPLHGWGEMAIWAWKGRRVLDALVQQPEVDHKRIIVAGGSRYASAALIVAARDERVALLYCWQGVPRTRRFGYQGKDFKSKYAPIVEDFVDAGALECLPIDSHCLLAAVAPRPVLFSVAGYPGPYGFSEEMMHHYNHARPAYEFLGARFEEVAKYPAERKGWKTNIYGKGPIALLMRDGAHTWHVDDWKYLLDFADEKLAKPKRD
jgi:hypothetical protein